MKYSRKKIIIECIAAIALVLYILWNAVNARRNLVNCVFEKNRYYVLCILFIINVCIAINSKRYFRFFVVSLLAFFVWFSFADIKYSPVDEALNFENINFIIDNHRLVKFSDPVDFSFLNSANDSFDRINQYAVNYEAVQAPLFYIIFALFGFFIKSAYWRFHIFRILSLAFVPLTFYIVNKTVQYLQKENIIRVNEKIYRLVLLFTLFNPAYLHRASRLNNEILVCFLMSVFLYLAFKCVLEGYSKKIYWQLSFLCILIFMSKSTAIYVYAVFGIIILLQRKLLKAIIPGVSTAMLIVPWVWMNFKNYHSLTGMKQHLDIVMPLVNPNNVKIDLFEAFFYMLPNTLFSGEEVVYSASELVWISLPFFVMIFIIIVATSSILRDIKSYKFDIERYDKKTLIDIVCVSLIVFCLIVLTMGTISTRICSVRGRYVYAAIIVMVILVLNEIEGIQHKDVFVILLCVVMGLIYTRCSVTYIEKIYRHQELYGRDISSCEIYDFNDENWTHGYCAYDNCLMVEVEDGKDVSHYKYLVGHIIDNGDNDYIITSVSDSLLVDDVQVVKLYLNRAFDISCIKDNKIELEAYCKAKNYNVGGMIKTLNDIHDVDVAQSMRLKSDDDVWGAELFYATYGERNYIADIDYRVENVNGEILSEGSNTNVHIGDGAYCRIYFDTPIRAKTNDEIIVTVCVRNAESKAITMWSSVDDEYTDGELYVDGNMLEGQDIGFRLLRIER